MSKQTDIDPAVRSGFDCVRVWEGSGGHDTAASGPPRGYWWLAVCLGFERPRTA